MERIKDWFRTQIIWWKIKRAIRRNQRLGIGETQFYIDGNKVTEIK